MGRMKSVYEAILKAQQDAILPTPQIKPPQVYVMTCNGKPVAAYVDKQTAEYEAHLCAQGDEVELGQHNTYVILTLDLTTHRV